MAPSPPSPTIATRSRVCTGLFEDLCGKARNSSCFADTVGSLEDSRGRFSVWTSSYECDVEESVGHRPPSSTWGAVIIDRLDQLARQLNDNEVEVTMGVPESNQIDAREDGDTISEVHEKVERVYDIVSALFADSRYAAVSQAGNNTNTTQGILLTGLTRRKTLVEDGVTTSRTPVSRDDRTRSIPGLAVEPVKDKSIYSSSTLQDGTEWLRELRQYAKCTPRDHFLSGDHLEGLSNYVSRAQRSQGSSSAAKLYSPSSEVNAEFAVFYDFNSSEPENALSHPSQLEDIGAQNSRDKHQSQLLFLRGHPSPAWINAVGNAFSVDPQFFYHHLWKFSQRRDTARTWPPLASRAVKESRFCLPTLGYLANPGPYQRRDYHVRRLRNQAARRMNKYLWEVRHGKQHAELGDSLLRQLAVHDGANFSYEQYISVWTEQTQKGWFTLVLLDVGTNGLRTCTPNEANEWLTPLGGIADDTLFVPTVVADEMKNVPDDASTSSSVEQGIPQNAKHLCRGYHHGLDTELARKSSFYALMPLWKLITASEKQFLNMMRDIVTRDIREGRAAGDDQDDAALSNLLYNQDILEQHAERLRHNARTIEKCTAWPRAINVSELDTRSMENVGTSMLEDFEDLLHRARHLETKCDQGAHRIMRLVGHAESKKQMSQQDRLEVLTKLGFLFFPTQLIAALFGMNFKQFGQGELSVWIYFAVTVPLLFVLWAILEPKPRAVIFGWCSGSRKRDTLRDGT